MGRHHRWDEDEDPENQPDLNDPKTAAALDRAVRDLRRVKLFHLVLLAVGFGLLGLAVMLKSG